MTGLEANNPISLTFDKFAVKPNPAGNIVTIGYSLVKVGHINLKLYDPTGRLVKTILEERQSAGDHRIIYNSSDLPSGVYFLELILTDERTGSAQLREKLILRQ
jgi:hypothetical protein